MVLELYLSCDSAGALRAFLDAHLSQGALLLPRPEGEQAIEQFAQVTLHVTLPGVTLPQPAEVLQLMPDGGLVLRLVEPAEVMALVEGEGGGEGASAAAPRISWSAPSREQGGDAAEAPAARGAVLPQGMGPVSWPIEKLQHEWGSLSIADKISVAKRGNLAARRMILKLQDRKLHQYVLANAQITSEEVSAMASMTGLEPELLKRIASRPEWVRHHTITRNLICNPKLSLDVVKRLIGKLPDMELRRLSKTGRVRDSVKRLIVRKVSG